MAVMEVFTMSGNTAAGFFRIFFCDHHRTCRRGRSVSGQTEQEEWRDGLMAKGADIALVTYTRW